VSDIRRLAASPVDPTISPLTTQADKVMRQARLGGHGNTQDREVGERISSPFFWAAGCSRRSRALAAAGRRRR
jgi:hypothetical protein